MIDYRYTVLAWVPVSSQSAARDAASTRDAEGGQNWFSRMLADGSYASCVQATQDDYDWLFEHQSGPSAVDGLCYAIWDGGALSETTEGGLLAHLNTGIGPLEALIALGLVTTEG